MSFPTGTQSIREKISELNKVTEKLQDEIVELEERRKSVVMVGQVIRNLCASPYVKRPGKYSPACFFLDQSGRRVVPEHMELDYQGGHIYPVVNSSDIMVRECPGCQTEQPIIEWYCQTYDSPQGDCWTKRLLILCIDCVLTTVISSRTADSEF